MGKWLATVRFPDGTRKYATYSTVTESLLSGLYSEMCPEGSTLPDGSECYRSEAAGEPDPEFPGAETAPVDELMPVLISVEPDDDTWHGLFCPRRRVVLGPLHSYHATLLQERFLLVPDGGEVRHLLRADADPPLGQPPTAACGRPVPGEPVTFNLPWRSDGRIGYEDGPRMDLYAGWSRGDVCRECLVSQLPEAESDAGPARPPTPRPGVLVRILSWVRCVGPAAR